jgi:hypothetical protein
MSDIADIEVDVDAHLCLLGSCLSDCVNVAAEIDRPLAVMETACRRIITQNLAWIRKI